MIVGISGAAGIAYGIRELQMLRTLHIETHLVLASGARLRAHRSEMSMEKIEALATQHHHEAELAAVISSGSSRTAGMMPCSMRTLAAVAHGAPSKLLTRAAHVTLKERSRLVLLTRESPLNQVHPQNMLAVTQMGGVIFPPVPVLYSKPETIEEMIDFTVMSVFNLFDIDTQPYVLAGAACPAYPGQRSHHSSTLHSRFQKGSTCHL